VVTAGGDPVVEGKGRSKQTSLRARAKRRPARRAINHPGLAAAKTADVRRRVTTAMEWTPRSRPQADQP